MTSVFTSLRTVVTNRYALLAPESFVASNLPGWTDATCVVQISPAMGAKFSQTLITLGEGSRGAGHSDDDELFAFVLEGNCVLSAGGRTYALGPESFAFVPATVAFELTRASNGTRLLLFQKQYEPSTESEHPGVFVSAARNHSGQPFLGDPSARLQVLLPETAAFDMAVNIFNFEPGATLPFVESHIMEHGLMMLSGQGVYRFDRDWHPVQAGDAVWMAPYCPQWFVAMGKTPARYIYYKNVNRAPRLS